MDTDEDLMTPCNSLLVIGNGFDVGLRLPTKYTDFMKNFLEYRCYLHKLPSPKNSSGDSEKAKVYSLFKEKMDNWKTQYKGTSKTDGQKIFNNIILKNKLILILIFKYNYKELFRLNGITLKTGERNSKGAITLYPATLSEQFYHDTEITGSEICWFNLEEILAEISDSKKYKSIISSINAKTGKSCILTETGINIGDSDNIKDYEELKEGLLFLKSSLSIYFRCVEETYLTSPSEQTKQLFKKICDNLEYQQNRKFVNDYSEIISLNYTHSAQTLFGIPTKYPHGQIYASAPEKSEIVLGYYNSTEENNFDTSFVDFQKYYQRLLLGTGNYETTDKKILYIDFYGFSCDPADTELIKFLLSEHKEVNRIRVFCFQDRGQNIINMVKSIGRKDVLDLTKKQSKTDQPKLIFKLIN